MTVITHNRRRSRLSTLIDQPGGISVGVALAQATRNLSALSERSREIILEQIQALVEISPPAGPQGSPSILETVYQHASAIIDAACPFEMPDLCAAAANLCDLIDGAPEDQSFDWRIVTVHAQSMRLLLSLDADAIEARTQVLNSLREVLKAKVTRDESPPFPDDQA